MVEPLRQRPRKTIPGAQLDLHGIVGAPSPGQKCPAGHVWHVTVLCRELAGQEPCNS